MQLTLEGIVVILLAIEGFVVILELGLIATVLGFIHEGTKNEKNNP